MPETSELTTNLKHCHYYTTIKTHNNSNNNNKNNNNNALILYSAFPDAQSWFTILCIIYSFHAWWW